MLPLTLSWTAAFTCSGVVSAGVAALSSVSGLFVELSVDSGEVVESFGLAKAVSTAAFLINLLIFSGLFFSLLFVFSSPFSTSVLALVSGVTVIFSSCLTGLSGVDWTTCVPVSSLASTEFAGELIIKNPLATTTDATPTLKRRIDQRVTFSCIFFFIVKPPKFCMYLL